MKMLMLTSLSEFQDEIENVLKQNDVAMYFEVDIKSFRLFKNPEHHLDNWFGHSRLGVNSFGLFAFLEKKRIDALMVALKNASTQKSIPLSAFVLDVEQTI